MRIDDGTNGIGAAGRAATPAGGGRAGRTPGEAPAAATDRVTLSDTARELAWLRAAVGPLDDVREDRIEALRPVVDGGDYRVEAPRVAQRFLIEELGGLVA